MHRHGPRALPVAPRPGGGGAHRGRDQRAVSATTASGTPTLWRRVHGHWLRADRAETPSGTCRGSALAPSAGGAPHRSSAHPTRWSAEMPGPLRTCSMAVRLLAGHGIGCARLSSPPGHRSNYCARAARSSSLSRDVLSYGVCCCGFVWWTWCRSGWSACGGGGRLCGRGGCWCGVGFGVGGCGDGGCAACCIGGPDESAGSLGCAAVGVDSDVGCAVAGGVSVE